MSVLHAAYFGFAAFFAVIALLNGIKGRAFFAFVDAALVGLNVYAGLAA